MFEEIASSLSSMKLFDALSTDEKRKLEAQSFVSQFKKNKLEKEAQKNWDKFYNRNREKFFKDRHWTQKEFSEICKGLDFQKNINFIEAGCGVGNLLFPILECYPHWKLYGFDFSKNAINMLNERAKKMGATIVTEVVDLTDEEAVSRLEFPQADLLSLVFMLSAIDPEKYANVLKNISRLVKPGGYVIFRDYAIYDYAMLRFKHDCKLSDSFYVRQDGTRAYYFNIEELEKIFLNAGFHVINTEYLNKRTINAKEDVNVPRKFVQGCFQKESI